MAKWVSVALVLIAVPFLARANAKADAFDLKVEVSFNGRVVSSPRVVARAGETATIRQGAGFFENFIEITPFETEVDGRKAIHMKFVIGVITKDGRKTVISKPELVARENERAEIKVGNRLQQVSLSVLAERMSQ